MHGETMKFKALAYANRVIQNEWKNFCQKHI